MATKSFLKDVVIKDTKLACQFVDTLSNAQKFSAAGGHRYEESAISRKCTELKAGEIKDFFDIK